MDIEQCRADLLSAGRALIEKHPQTGAIVLECTNMVPYAADMQRQLLRHLGPWATLVHP